MGRRTVLVDDYDGSTLPDNTQPTRLSLGRTVYEVYLSDENHDKLLEAVEPFIKNADKSSSTMTVSVTRSRSASKADRDYLRRVREWAQETGFTYKGANGEDRTLGPRGRIPDEVQRAYDNAMGE